MTPSKWERWVAKCWRDMVARRHAFVTRHAIAERKASEERQAFVERHPGTTVGASGHMIVWLKDRFQFTYVRPIWVQIRGRTTPPPKRCFDGWGFRGKMNAIPR